MKHKNPLYVVKGKTVLEAQGLWDMLVKKFNLEPVITLVLSLLKMLLEQVNSYPLLVFVKSLVDEVMKKLTSFFDRFQSA
jgi:hypothetical protein